MPLTVEEIEAIVGELAGPLAGGRVDRVLKAGDRSIVIKVKAPAPAGPLRAVRGEERRWRPVFLLLSAAPDLARVHVVPAPAAAVRPAGGFAQWLAGEIEGARLEAIRQPGRGRAVEIDLSRGSPAARAEGAGARRREGSILIAELWGDSPNIVLLDARRRLQGALLEVKSHRGPGPASVKPGEVYPSAAPPVQSSALSGVAGSPWRYLEPEARPAAGDRPPEGLEAEFPLNLALARYYGKVEEEALVVERRGAIARRIKTLLAKRRTLLRRLEEDLSRAKEGEAGLRMGELLKGELPKLRRGMERVEVVDYYSPELSRVEIALDPGRTPQENIERYFERYRKAQRALPIIAARLERVRREVARLEELGSRAREAGAGDLQALEGEVGKPAHRLAKGEGAAKGEGPARGEGQAEKPAPGKMGGAEGPRRFTSLNGLAILVGKSAERNDELTFQIAHGNDLFLHVAGRPGAHVVVRAERGRPVPPETLLDAAQLALYYSLPAHKRRLEAPAPAADVDYTEVKHVRKARGARPGEVLLARHHTIRVRLEKARLDRLRGDTGLPQET